jgi:hypothetical protein
LLAGFSFSADRCSSARSNCAEAAARLESEVFVVSEAPAQVSAVAKKGIANALSSKIAALARENRPALPRANRAANSRDAKTGENRANLMRRILDLAPMPNLNPRCC